MKLNLPIKHKKLISLSLLGLVAKGADGGQAFKNCLTNGGEVTNDGRTLDLGAFYSLLTQLPLENNSAISNGKTLIICCSSDRNQCFFNSTCLNFTDSGTTFGCNKIGQTMNCGDSQCNGILGVAPITTNITLDPTYCQNDLTTVANYISTISPDGLSKGYAHFLCPVGSTCSQMFCDWDNGGWTCGLNNYQGYCGIDASGNYVCPTNCTLQWTAPWPGPTDKNPYKIHNNPHLAEKIGIPVGVVGTITIGGVTYYLYKKKKGRQSNNQDSTIQSSSLGTTDQLTILPTVDSGSDKQPTLFIKDLEIDIDKEKENDNAVQVKPSLKHLIGEGGYGKVYYGKWGQQDVAIKKLYLSLHNTSKSQIKDIANEINILKNLRNRYIIQYYGAYFDNQEFLIIMDYAENGTLTKYINDNKDKEHDWNFNNELIRQMALGLVYIHQQGIIHRDLKSMNILLDKHLQVKISDFGLAKTKNISSLQSKHEVVGTLRWMAPEIIKDSSNPRYSEQSDIYAFGMIIWEIAANKTIPFEEIGDRQSVLIHILSNGKETIPDNTPQDIRYIIKHCWKNNPNNRISLEGILEIIENKKISDSRLTSSTYQTQQITKSKEIQNENSLQSLQETPPKKAFN